MYYLDANTLIYPALYEGEKAAHARELIESIVAGDEAGATASLTLDEVVWVLTREASREVALEQGQRLLELANLRFLDVGGQTMLTTLQRLKDYDHLAPRDAVHLAVMEDAGIYTIVSDDDDFDDLETIDRHPLEKPIVSKDNSDTKVGE